MGRFLETGRLTRQNIEALLPESAPRRKIIHRIVGAPQRCDAKTAATAGHSMAVIFRAVYAPWRKTAPIIYRRNSDCDHSRRDGWWACHSLAAAGHDSALLYIGRNSDRSYLSIIGEHPEQLRKRKKSSPPGHSPSC